MYNYLLYLKLFATQAFVPSLTCRNRTTNHLSGEMLYMYVTIELLGLRWQRECHDMYRFVSATHVLLNSSLDMSVYLINVYICMKDDLQIWPSLCHLSPGISMVRASHRRSEGCGFDSHLGLRNIFLSLR